MSDPKQRIVVDGLDLASIFRFQRILRAAVTALYPSRLIVALLLVVALLAVGRLWDGVTGSLVPAGGLLAPTTSTAREAAAQGRMRAALVRHVTDESLWPAAPFEAVEVLAVVEEQYREQRESFTAGRIYNGQRTTLPRTEIKAHDADYVSTRRDLLTLLPVGPFAATVDQVTASFNRAVRGVIYFEPGDVYASAGDVFLRLPVALWQQQRWFAIVYGIFFIVVVTIGGGALARMAACDFAGQERLRVRDAFDFALGNRVKLMLTPTLPLIVAAAVAVIMLIPGLLMVPWLDVVGGLLYGISMFLGFVLAFILIGYAIGAPLLLPAVACENCDAADAQQRVYAYVLSRPLHLLGYGATTLAGLVMGFVVVGFVAATLLNFTAGLAGTFTGNSALVGAGGSSLFALAPVDVGAVHATGHSSMTAGLVSFWQGIVIDLVVAYVVAYFFSASTMVYLLMRRVCDGQDVEEIWRPGLTPGTLVPLPQPRVIDATEPEELADRMFTGALRTATAARFGSAAADTAEREDEPASSGTP